MGVQGTVVEYADDVSGRNECMLLGREVVLWDERAVWCVYPFAS